MKSRTTIFAGLANLTSCHNAKNGDGFLLNIQTEI